ncbi:MAG TPA: hypothetical protein VEA63_09110 [Opitutus sp.]|nr:hypothetical protein [Opitutus sp.]
MTIDWLNLLLAVVLLWLPRQWLRLGSNVIELPRRSRRRSHRDTNPAIARDASDASVSFRAEIGKLRNFVDFFRAALGGVLLLGTLPGREPAFHVVEGAAMSAVNLAANAPLAILLVGVLLQTFRFETRVTLFPPIFYLSGLTFGLCGIYPAVFAMVLVWAVNFALPTPAGFLAVYALLVTTFGLLFQRLDNKLPFVAAGLLFLPVLLSLLTRRRLVLLTKRVKASSSGLAT